MGRAGQARDPGCADNWERLDPEIRPLQPWGAPGSWARLREAERPREARESVLERLGGDGGVEAAGRGETQARVLVPGAERWGGGAAARGGVVGGNSS